MAFRGTESPMDFEWQGYGPVDPNSPYHKHIMESHNKKRTFNQFDSPLKPAFPTASQPKDKPIFSSDLPLSQPQASPFRAPSFTTPRKPFDIDFSSGPENSSPAEQADNEDTPEARPLPVEFTSGSTKPPNKRNSLFGIYGKFAPSPGRGEIRRPHSDAIAKRIHKKRRRAQNFEKQLIVGRRSSDDTSEEDAGPLPPNPSQQPQPPTHEVGWLTGLFTFIHTYPDAPSIIAKYLQVFFNAIILSGVLFMIYTCYATIRADVDRASDEAMADVMAEMAACTKNYVENRCAADARLPALEQVCSNWELCMNRDATAVKRARLSAHTFAEIFNSFVEPISLKTMIFSVTMVVVGLLVNNATFTYYRRQQEHYHHPNTGPYRHPSGPYMHQQHQHTLPNLHSQPTIQPYPYNQSQPPQLHSPIGGGWQGDHIQSYDNQNNHHQQRLEYSRSPSKEQHHRARSRSPEKKRVLA